MCVWKMKNPPKGRQAAMQTDRDRVLVFTLDGGEGIKGAAMVPKNKSKNISHRINAILVFRMTSGMING